MLCDSTVPGGPAIATNDRKKPVLDLLERGYFAIFLTIVTDFKSLRQKNRHRSGIRLCTIRLSYELRCRDPEPLVSVHVALQ
jgi:hypothetical protein